MSKDLLREYNFQVFIGGFRSAGFVSCKGLSATSVFTEYKEGGALAPTPLFEGFKFEPLILSQGLTRTDSDAYYWWESSANMDTLANMLNRRNIIIEVWSGGRGIVPESLVKSGMAGGKVPVRYKVSGAVVEKVTFGDLNSVGDGIVVIQNIVLKHSGIERLQLFGGLI